jgi:D-alanine-D-alanine ligase
MSARVVVIAGGLSPERDVSLRSGRRVAEDLREAGIEAQVRDIDATLIPSLIEDPPSCALPLVHGVAGEDGSLQEVLQSIGLPFVGSSAHACRRSFDKATAGALLADAGISVPDSIALPQTMFRDLGAPVLLAVITERLGLPLVIKPNRGGSALGVSIVHDAGGLPAAMVGAFAYGEVVLIQRYVQGTEIAVAVTDSGDSHTAPRAMPCVEIVPDSGLYDYTARYTAGTTEFFTPARLPAETLAAAAQTAVHAHEVLGLRDWSRSDLMVDDAGTAWFLEANVAPGMTETSLFPQAIAASHTTASVLLAALVHRATNRAENWG